ncbi:biotin-dependent 3-methylcrotonyl-coenzyme A carboxylase beta1 subunit-like [Liolophura sinensis]|uniref:biotin-dependent 3-methylcrotonyl-coenzyme A carboxylase beta1 subunit-like n=1 Tax=Liolophura sinensis TaxID=3198878 RepID=UPI003158CCC0
MLNMALKNLLNLLNFKGCHLNIRVNGQFHQYVHINRPIYQLTAVLTARPGNCLMFSTSASIQNKPFPVLQNVDINASVMPKFSASQTQMEDAVTNYQKLLSLAVQGGGEKAIKRQRMQRKLLAEERLSLLLDDESDFLELSPLAGMGMDYGNVPRAGLITGIGLVNGVYCMLLINDATVKGGTVYPITLKKQLRAQEIAEQNHLPCVYVIDSGGGYLPLQAEIFPDKNHGGRVFYNEAILSAKGIPQIAVVCGSCTAGGAYIPVMANEAIIINKIGRIFLGGPPLVKAATGEVITADDLGGAVLHSTVSGCTDHYADTEEEAFAICKDGVASFNISSNPTPEEWDAPQWDSQELIGLAPTNIDDYNVYRILARVIDGSRFHEFKALYGTSVVTGFCRIEGYLVGVVANKGEITGDGALKGAHFITLCSDRSIPLVFLQNSFHHSDSKEPLSGEQLGETVKNHGKMLSALTLASVPKLTVVVGGSYGMNNYLMAGRSMSPNFLFVWPSAKIGAMELQSMVTHMSEAGPSSAQSHEKEVKDKLSREMSAVFCSSRLWDDGIIVPQDTRQVLGRCLRIVSQTSRGRDVKVMSQGGQTERGTSRVIRM